MGGVIGVVLAKEWEWGHGAHYCKPSLYERCVFGETSAVSKRSGALGSEEALKGDTGECSLGIW